MNVLRRTREIFIDLKDFHVFCFLLGFFFGVACTVPVARDQYTALFWRASLGRLSDCTIDNDGRDYCLIKSTLFSLSSLFFCLGPSMIVQEGSRLAMEGAVIFSNCFQYSDVDYEAFGRYS